MGTPHVTVSENHVVFEWAFEDLRLALFVSALPNDSSWTFVRKEAGDWLVKSGGLSTLPMAALREVVER